jgi:hypothetical protein
MLDTPVIKPGKPSTSFDQIRQFNSEPVMTVVENLECELDRWHDYADLAGFQKLRPNRDGQMPVGRDRARHRAFRRASPHRALRPRPVNAMHGL